jgi:hypothetical protein
MKFLGALIITLVASSAAFAHNDSIRCRGKWGSEVTIELEGRLGADIIRKVKATVTDNYLGKERREVGRRSELLRDESYRPRKYAGHSRYRLKNLVTEDTYETFTPIDQCSIDVLIPDKRRGSSFEAPTVVSCDQGGGTLTLACVFTGESEE